MSRPRRSKDASGLDRNLSLWGDDEPGCDTTLSLPSRTDDQLVPKLRPPSPSVVDPSTASASQLTGSRSKNVIDSRNDGLNRTERVVYEAMCAEVLRRRGEARQGALDCQTAPVGGLLSIGYGALCRIVSLHKRTLQRILARLIQKKFISIKSKPSGEQEPTTYCVHTPAEIDSAFEVKGWRHWQRVGAGIKLVA